MRLGDFTLGELRDLTDATVLVAASSEAGIFRALRAGAASADELAAKLGYDPRATRIVLHALVETGLLEHDGHRFAPSPRCTAELCDPEESGYAGRGLPHWLRMVRALTRLGEALRRGGPLERRTPGRTPAEVARFTTAMAAAPAERIERIVDLSLGRCPQASSVLDLGGGPGHMTRAFVARGLRGTLFDTSDIVDHVVDAFGLGDVTGLEVVAGDFNEDPLPSGPYDVVLLSNVIHIYEPEAAGSLFRKAAGVLAPGGVLAVAEFLRGRSPRAAQLGVQMLLKSDAGDTYTGEEIGGWMEKAGFVEVRVDPLDEERDLVTGVRAGPTGR